MNTLAISQSNYFPWLGYFELLNTSTHFTYFDNAQYTKNDWRNRNILKTDEKNLWLTLPVHLPNGLQTRICEVEVQQENWLGSHKSKIINTYKDFKYFKSNSEWMLNASDNLTLSKINQIITNGVAEKLEVKCEITNYLVDISLNRNERLIEACKAHGASTYLTSTGAKYLDEEQFKREKILVSWCDYNKSKTFYERNYTKQSEFLSILDSIFRFGIDELKVCLHS